MPGPTKRTRQDDHLDNSTTTTNSSSSSSSTSSSSASTPTALTPPVTRNSAANANSDTIGGTVTGTGSAGTPRRVTASSSAHTSTTTAPNRPILTRSAATQAPSPRNTGLTRSTSLLNVTTRRSGLTAASSLPGIMAAPSSGAASSSSSSGSSSSSSGRVGMLTRTQSTPSLVSPSQLKATASAGGSGGAAGKGGDDGGSGGTGGRRFGKGKENIPPKKDEENEPEEGSSRKRPRMSSRSSTSGRNGRGRSGSVVSVRSETSGRHSSLAPSSSASSISSWSARLPSPAPSQASSAAQTETADTATSVDPLDMLRNDDDFDIDKTPTKSRPVTRSTVLPPTPPPSSPSVRDAEITEPKEKKTNPYKQLKAFLRLSSTPSSEAVTLVDQVIIGRDEEKTILRSYLANRNDVDVGMYVSGPPGTGKTALVTALGRQLTEEEGWQVVELGCMGLKTTDIWRRIGEELGCGKTERDVKEYLKQDEAKVFIILDEVDSLMPPPPSIAPPATSHLLTRLFSLPLTSSTIKLIAISNTLDLTLRARLVLPDSAQPAILPFKAYGATEMAPIVSARLASANVDAVKVDQTAVMLLTKKVEAQNGDLRMCLGVLSSAITLAEAEWIKKTSAAAASEPGKIVPMTKVAVTHILKALTSYTQQLKAAAGSGSTSTSATGKKIRSVQLQGKMVLVAVLIFVARSRAGLNGCPAIGSGNITPPLTPGRSTSTLSTDLTSSALYATYSHLLSHATSPFPPAAESDYRDLLSNLETLGLISIVGATSSAGMTRTSSGRHKASGAANGGGRVELCVREDEVRDGLGLVIGQQKGIAEEEVKRVWEREEGKIRRVREKAAQVAEAIAAGEEITEGYF
ncbi:DNA clamp loader [Kwoniella heveanensis CBS 569]|nr:DNA clamp loader [Kwoniella heveanensis CBS 569]